MFIKVNGSTERGSAGHMTSNIPLHCAGLLRDGWPSPGVGWKPSLANDHRRKKLPSVSIKAKYFSELIYCFVALS